MATNSKRTAEASGAASEAERLNKRSKYASISDLRSDSTDASITRTPRAKRACVSARHDVRRAQLIYGHTCSDGTTTNETSSTPPEEITANTPNEGDGSTETNGVVSGYVSNDQQLYNSWILTDPALSQKRARRRAVSLSVNMFASMFPSQ